MRPFSILLASLYMKQHQCNLFLLLRCLMKNNDVELIHRVREGDDSAFTSLVIQYQKQVHALAWKIIGDFPRR